LPAGELRVASFNVLNYFNGNGLGGGFPTARGAHSAAEFARQHDKIVAALIALDADIIGLMEIENDGYGVNSAIQELVDGLNAVAGAGTYAFVNPGGPMGSDEIAVGLLYKPGVVTPVGTTAVLDDAAFVAPFGVVRNRPALVQTFQVSDNSLNSYGEALTVVVNHLKSKGSGCGAGDDDAATGQGNCNGTRAAAANYLVNTWLPTDPTGTTALFGSHDTDYLIIGDLNAYAQETPITTLIAAGYTNLFSAYQGTDAHSYVFDGQWGNLDHALGSSSLRPQVVNAAAWPINADESTLFDYNDTVLDSGEPAYEVKPTTNPLYAANAFRSSDHDPLVVDLNLGTNNIPVIINEVDYDQPGADNAEFIELKNISGQPVNLDGYTLELVNGNGNTVYATLTLPNVTLAAGGYYVLCATDAQLTNCDWLGAFASIQNGNPDAITLRDNGVLVDSLSYGGFMPGATEGASAPNDSAVIGRGLSRYPDGADSDDNSADFSLRCVTPGIANSSQTTNCTVQFVENCTLATATPVVMGTTNPITLQFANLGAPAIGCLRVMYFGYNHPNASAPLQTGAYWHIEASPSDAGATTAFTYDLTLPFTNPVHPADKICRWLEGAGPGYGWDCVAGDIGDYAPTHLTRRELHGFSDWAVGDSAGPTAVTLHTLSTPNQTMPLLLAGVLALLLAATAVYLKRILNHETTEKTNRGGRRE
jgi:predicted extracellular nuclease